MGSAFDWSPGGCCCTLPGWFDLYDSNLPAYIRNGEFVRVPVIGESDATADDSRAQINWSVPSSIGPIDNSYNWGGQNPGKEYVWRSEHSNTTQASYMALYDTAAQTELTRIVDTLGISGGTTLGSENAHGGTGWNPDQIGTAGTTNFNGNINVFSSNGTFTSTPINNDPTIKINAMAPRNWPKTAATIQRDAQHLAFVIGDLDAVGGTLAITNQQTIFEQSDIVRGYWAEFDYFLGHWGGYLVYQLNGSSEWRARLYVDNVLINDLHCPTDSPGSSTPIPRALWYNVHVGFPHETLGEGYVAVGTTMWQYYPTYYNSSQRVPPTDGIYADTYVRPRRVVIYKNGVEYWRSGKISVTTGFRYSSDRWLWLEVDNAWVNQNQSTAGTDVNEFTSGLFTSYAGTPQYYLIRHDGTQVIPIGKDETTPHQMGAPLNALQSGAIVCNTSLVPNTAPAELAYLAL
jgi:hypothetical protein